MKSPTLLLLSDIIQHLRDKDTSTLEHAVQVDSRLVSPPFGVQ
jgi:hypothetical protein